MGDISGSKATPHAADGVDGPSGYDPDRLLALAEECERAIRADRDLDADIALAMGWRPLPNPDRACGLIGRWIRPDGSITCQFGEPSFFTASLDAAMTLVPDDLTFMLQRRFNGWHAEVGYDNPGNAVTAALAICAAAFRARAKA